RADPRLAAQVFDRHPGVALLEHGNDLGLGELRLLHTTSWRGKDARKFYLLGVYRPGKLTIPPRTRTAAGPGSGERSGRGWPLPAGHSPNKGALRPLRAPVPAPPRTGRPDPPDANPIRDNPSSHPAGTYNPLRPRPAPFCCLENNNSAGSA